MIPPECGLELVGEPEEFGTGHVEHREREGQRQQVGLGAVAGQEFFQAVGRVEPPEACNTVHVFDGHFADRHG
jgi:hypothetical protein